MLYFYPEAPDIKWFLDSKHTELKISWINNPITKREAYIKTTTSKGNEDFEIIPNFGKILSENIKISYPSLKTNREEKITIINPQWDFIQIFPQSEIQIEFEWKNIKKIEKLNWKVWFLSWIFESNLELSWFESFLSQTEQERIEWSQSSYKHDLVSYLKNQVWESNIRRANNTIMYNIDGIIIKFLAKLFPVTFSKNLNNYNEFQKYFNLIEGNEINLVRYNTTQLTWQSINSFWWTLRDNIDAWKNNTYWWFKKPEKR